MVPQEQIIFTDRSVYITNTRLVLRKGGVYPISNLAQVSLGRYPFSRLWIGPFIVGLILLVLGALLSQNAVPAGSSALLNGKFYVVIGVLLLVLAFASVIFQLTFPLYVVVLKGTFGYARPIKRRTRRSIGKIVDALNEAINRRNASTVINQSTHVDASYRSSDINIGSGAQVSGFNAFNTHNLNMLSNQAGGDPRAGRDSLAFDAGGIPGWGVSPLVRPSQPAHQPAMTGAGVRKIIISYSQKDRHWLELLRTHLAVLEQRQMIELWDDTRIAPGMHMQQAMSDALMAADFALLLVSADFLASEVIMSQELPQILQRLSQSQFTILPLILSPCLYDESPLRVYQPFNPNGPLSGLPSPKRDEMLVNVANKIKRAVS